MSLLTSAVQRLIWHSLTGIVQRLVSHSLTGIMNRLISHPLQIPYGCNAKTDFMIPYRFKD